MPQIFDDFEFDDFMTRGATHYKLIGRDSYGGYEFEAPVYTGPNSLWFSEEEIFDGQELVASAEIISKFSVAGEWKRGDYVVIDKDTTLILDPIAANAKEIGKVGRVAADALDSSDAMFIYVM